MRLPVSRCSQIIRVVFEAEGLRDLVYVGHGVLSGRNVHILAINLVDNCCKSVFGYCFTGAAYPLEKNGALEDPEMNGGTSEKSDLSRSESTIYLYKCHRAFFHIYVHLEYIPVGKKLSLCEKFASICEQR